MPWYSSGTVSIANNATDVYGTGTKFSANSRVGDAFRGPDGRWYELVNIASDTLLSIKPNYLGVSVSPGSYAIAPMQGYVKDSADALRNIVNQYGTLLAGLAGNAVGSTAPAPLRLFGGSTEWIRINSGSVVLGDVASSNPLVDKKNALLYVADGRILHYSGAGPTYAIGTSGNTYMQFFYNGTAALTGSISTNGTSTSYNTSSDRHLKDDIEAIPNGPEIFDAIEWVRYHWKANHSLGWAHGVIAQQLKPVFPEAVAGEDGVFDRDGNLIPMSVDYSKLIPVLGAKIRSQDERIAQLEAQVQILLEFLPAA